MSTLGVLARCVGKEKFSRDKPKLSSSRALLTRVLCLFSLNRQMGQIQKWITLEILINVRICIKGWTGLVGSGCFPASASDF
jgi:hypothetical protein